MVRLIATDLDGTLVRSDGETVSERTRRALAAARDAQITIVLVSARGPIGVGDVAGASGCDGLAICSNGALVVDLASREVVRHRPLAADVATQMIRVLRARLPNVCFATENEGVFALEPAFKGAWDWEPPAGTRYADALELVAAPVTKLIARDATCSIAELAAAARDVAGDAAAVAMSGEWVVEISAAGVNKAAALKELAADLGVAPDEVVAFGDYPNDLPMLEWAGRSIAPANAHPDVLAQVDEVTTSNDDDGVALAIERLLVRAGPPTRRAMRDKAAPVLETERLKLREFAHDDLDELAAMVGDEEQMTFYPRPKTRDEAFAWIDRNRALYKEHGFGFWCLETRATSGFVGYCGIRPVVLEGASEIETGWHRRKTAWNRGIATEAATAARTLAFGRFDLSQLVAIIHPDHVASRRVARKSGSAMRGRRSSTTIIPP